MNFICLLYGLIDLKVIYLWMPIAFGDEALLTF